METVTKTKTVSNTALAVATAVALGAAALAFAVSPLAEKSGSKITSVLSCATLENGARMLLAEGAKPVDFLNGCQDLGGAGIKDYTFTCPAVTKFKTSWKACTASQKADLIIVGPLQIGGADIASEKGGKNVVKNSIIELTPADVFEKGADGNVFLLQYAVKNTGLASAPVSENQFLFNGEVVTTTQNPVLNYNTSDKKVISVKLPLKDGTFVIKLDALNNAQEADENNNIWIFNIKLVGFTTEQNVDLAMFSPFVRMGAGVNTSDEGGKPANAGETIELTPADVFKKGTASNIFLLKYSVGNAGKQSAPAYKDQFIFNDQVITTKQNSTLFPGTGNKNIILLDLPLKDGPFVIKLDALNNVQETNEDNNSWTFNIKFVGFTAATDTTVPTVNAVTPATATVNVAQTYPVAYSDNVGVVSCQLVFDSAGYVNMQLSGTTSGTATKSYTFSSAGSHTLQAKCKDAANNEGVGALTTIMVSAAPDTSKADLKVSGPAWIGGPEVKFYKKGKQADLNGTVELTPADVVEKSATGNTFFLRYTVKNDGTQSAPIYENQFIFNDQNISTTVNPVLNQGVSEQKLINVDLPLKDGTLVIRLDTQNQVAETNENNNTWTFNIKFVGF